MLSAEMQASCPVFLCTRTPSPSWLQKTSFDTSTRSHATRRSTRKVCSNRFEFAVAAGVAAKKYGIEDLEINIDRESGQWVSNYEISLESEGRILAQAVKQSINVKVREAERDSPLRRVRDEDR